jgi:hypothetical protein
MVTKGKAELTPLDDKKRVVVKIPEKPKFLMHLDADRDGKVDDDPTGLDSWNYGKGKKGAVILVNCNGTPTLIDNSDNKVNGTADIKDVAPLDIRRTGPNPPAGWKVTLSVSADDAKHIRIFDLRTAAGVEVIGPSKGEKYELPSLAFTKLEMGIEAVNYAGLYGGKAFSGDVVLTLTVDDKSSGPPTQRAKVRVAPWMLFHHLDKPEKLYVVAAGSNAAFVTELVAAAATAGVPLQQVDGTAHGDVWMQDIMEFGFSSLPGQTAARSVLETPRGRELRRAPLEFVSEELGYIQPVPDPPDPDTYRSSLNSGGNLECTPPFTGPTGKVYPFGRIYMCKDRGAAADAVEPGYAEFFVSQKSQDPIWIDAGWLAVGHVDEIISFVPATNALGFKLVLASAKLGMSLLETAAKAGARLLTGRQYVRGVPGEMLVSDLLSKGINWPSGGYKMTGKEFRDYNVVCQQKIDLAESVFKNALGLSAADICYAPATYIHRLASTPQRRLADALTAGMANMLVLDKHCIVAKPFGPVIGASDAFQEDYLRTLTACGLTATFVNDWNDYHINNGEVHCGTNTLRRPDANKKWWEFDPA